MIGAVLALAIALADRPAQVVPTADQAAYKAWLADRALDAEASFSVKPVCTDAAIGDLATEVVTITDPLPGFRGQALSETVRVDGCGRSLRINLNVLAPLQGRQWRARARIPGDSLTSLQMQDQVIPQLVRTLAPQRPAGCSDLGFGEAAVLARPGDVRLLGPGQAAGGSRRGVFYTQLTDQALQARLDATRAWAERWSLQACGKDVSVTILFAPFTDAPGTFFGISPTWLSGPTPRAANP